MCVMIWDVHQFNGHCLIPLDPWIPVPKNDIQVEGY